MLEMLSYPFMQNAFIAGVFVAVACSLLGVFLILRRLSLIGDGIAHISFGGVAAGLLFNITPLAGALLMGTLGALGVQRLRERAYMHGDTAIGIVSHASLGIGIFIVSIAGGLNVDILSYLFGSILSIKAVELAVSALLSVTVILFIIAFHEELFSISFDEESAKVSGINVGRLNTALILLTSVTIVSSMGVVGLLLASSLIVLPAASALQFRTSFRNTLILSAFFAVVSVVAGITLSYIFDFAASGTIVLLNALIFAGSYFCRECGKRWIG